MPTKYRAAFWYCIAVCSALLVAAATRTLGHETSLLLSRIGLLGITLAVVVRTVASYLFVRGRERRATQRRQELLQQLQSGQLIDISGNSSGLLMTLVLWVGLQLILQVIGNPSWPVVAIALVGLLSLFGAALHLAPLIGKPALRIAHDGIETPAYGKFSWHEIASFNIVELKRVGVWANHHLILVVPKLTERVHLMHWATHLLQRFFPTSKPEIRLGLAIPSEPAQVILDVCLDAWSRSTGKDRQSGIGPYLSWEDLRRRLRS